jgi:hypothetical protein
MECSKCLLRDRIASVALLYDGHDIGRGCRKSRNGRRDLMSYSKNVSRFSVTLLAILVLAGCATTKVTSQQSDIGNEKIARPDHIYVYSFAATPADLATEDASSAEYGVPSKPQSADEIETGRKLGQLVAKNLAQKIQSMGLPAFTADASTQPAVGDIVIHGHFQSIEEGSAGKRIVLGFGSGSADLQTAVTVYQMTSSGLRKLGGGTINAGGGKTPGVLLPLAVTVATANPIGLVVGGAVKAAGEISGRNAIEGSAERTAAQVANELEGAFQRQGWI